jgi:hypothetical protein
MSQELLFHKHAIFDVIRARTEAVAQEVQSIPSQTLLNASEHDLLQMLIEKFHLEVPTISELDLYIVHSGETQVDVSRDPMRMISDRSMPFYVTGTETVIGVPFQGDPAFFNIQPQTFSLNPPRAEITKSELLLRYVRTDQNGEAIKQEYQRDVNSIVHHLRSLSESAGQFNSQLEQLLTTQIKARKDRLLSLGTRA